MAKGKAKLILLAALALMAGGAALLALVRPRERPLLAHATKITRVPSAHPYYWWVSDSEVLTFQDPSRDNWTLRRVNVNTKSESPADRLTRLFAKSGGRPDTVQMAPLGDWIL